MICVGLGAYITSALAANDEDTPSEVTIAEYETLYDKVYPMSTDEVANGLQNIFQLIDEGCFIEARASIQALGAKLGAGHPELTRANTLIAFLEEPT